ncbi:hypothetical protein SZ64_13445 [Erythrobacter sp. SG61-1L]|uniref:hypothetical protein n=1 Tax=Erythrobacter sp. SG61-1L TaxID=1603897 RepID=UPI0006C8F9D1|nr:hypothetical protein [Erythrobacter sp. SG61-1L]KPL69017.1 hypothetical protein SZ64_13445 [Erythrobacter sp. SG61-1L]
MRKILASASVFALLSATAHAADGDASRVYKPSSAWQADFGDDYCRLARSFSDGKDTLSVALERIQPTNSVRLILVGNGIRMFRGSDQLGFTLSPSGGERKGPFWRSETTDGRQYLNLGEVFMAPPMAFGAPPGAPRVEARKEFDRVPDKPAAGAPPAPPQPGQPLAIPPYNRTAEQEFAKGVTAIDITSGVMEPARIETGNLKAPIGVLQQCADDLLAVWGLDPEKHKAMTRRAAPATEANKWLPTGTIGFGDFPKLGGSANQFRIMVSAEGKPTSCTVHWPTLEQKTNDAVCKAIMNKGEFSPALDAAGQPMSSYWTVAPFFLMPPFGGT